MPQIFHPSTNVFSRATIFGALLILAVIAWILGIVYRSSYFTQVYVVRNQPVQFSHEHHFSGLGIDCRYCHTTVEDSAFAGMPSTDTCMHCHAYIWTDAPMLEPVRESFRSGKPIEWTRVHDLPDFAYFNHSIHVQKGIGCVSCHGRVDQMPLVWRANTLQMEWCLDCHRHPHQHVRPRDKIYDFDWEPPAGEEIDLRERLVKEYDIKTLVDCSTCHR